MQRPNSIKVVLTGGGSAGHVIPNLALILELQKSGCSLVYLASHQGIENALLKSASIPVHKIRTGKFRRYFSFHNVTDLFGACAGVADAYLKLGKIKPDVVFSKGGYVALPVVIAAWLRRIPVVIHESDVTLGLANRISTTFARTICVTHEETKSKISKTKNVVVTGLPLRPQIFCGDKNKGLELCGFNAQKPVLLIIGGSLGSKRLNEVIHQSIHELLNRFQIAHVTGKGKAMPQNLPGYRQFEFINEIEHLYACADIIVSRAGATTVAEIIALKKPNVLIPFSATASRGDQLQNAALHEREGLSSVIREEDLTSRRLFDVIEQTRAKPTHRFRPHTFSAESASVRVCRIILDAARAQKH